MATLKVTDLGDYLKEQRQHAQLSLRQLAEQAGVSNPYLSQVERGLRKPSAEVLQQIAKGLRISAEALYIRAGILEDRGDRIEVEAAILTDPFLSERQRRVLLDIYETFRSENDREPPDDDNAGDVAVAVAAAVDVAVATEENAATGSASGTAGAGKTATPKAAARKTSARKTSTRKTPTATTTARKTSTSKSSTAKTTARKSATRKSATRKRTASGAVQKQNAADQGAQRPSENMTTQDHGGEN